MPEKRYKGRFSRQLASLYFCLCAFFCSCFSIFTFYMNRELHDRSITVQNWGLAKALAAELQPFVAPTVDIAACRRLRDRFQRYNPLAEICLLSSKGEQPIYRCVAFADEKVRVQALNELRAAIADARFIPAISRLHVSNNTAVPFSAASLTIGSDTGYLVVLFRTTNWTPTAALLFQDTGTLVFALLMLAGLFTGIILSIAVFRLLTRNLFEILDVVRSFRDGTFSRRVAIRSSNELGELGDTVNEMADRIVSNIYQLDQKDRLRRELVANIAHDLRAPASGIIGLADTLALRRNSLSEADMNRCIEGILHGGESLSHMISELFDLARLESGEVKCERRSVSVAQMGGTVSSRFKPLAERKGIRFESLLDANDAVVDCDVHLIERTLDNLLGNALKFTAQGGRIVLRASVMEGSVEFIVEDSGSGISEEDRERIFTRHERAADGSADVGLGLGLAIVVQILKLHGSAIELQSEVGKGSRFSFRLPTIGNGRPL